MRIDGSRPVVGLAVAVCMAGCVSANVTKFDPRAQGPRRTRPDSIVFYQTKAPECKYAEVAQVTVSQFFASWDKMVRKLRQTASAIGGDAVIAMRENKEITGATVIPHQVWLDEDWTLRGMVIRFDDSACAH